MEDRARCVYIEENFTGYLPLSSLLLLLSFALLRFSEFILLLIQKLVSRISLLLHLFRFLCYLYSCTVILSRK